MSASCPECGVPLPPSLVTAEHLDFVVRTLRMQNETDVREVGEALAERDYELKAAKSDLRRAKKAIRKALEWYGPKPWLHGKAYAEMFEAALKPAKRRKR